MEKISLTDNTQTLRYRKNLVNYNVSCLYFYFNMLLFRTSLSYGAWVGVGRNERLNKPAYISFHTDDYKHIFLSCRF